MSGLSAKVFRTFNASITLEKELPDAASMSGLSLQEKLNLYNTANRQVAILCNHQRTVSKAAETMFENLNEKLTTMKDQTGQLIEYVRVLRMYANCVLTLENSFFELIALVLLQYLQASLPYSTILQTLFVPLTLSSYNLNFFECYVRWKELAQAGKEKKIPLKEDDKDQVEVRVENLQKAQKKKEDAKTNEAKLLAASAIDEAKTASKQVT